MITNQFQSISATTDSTNRAEQTVIGEYRRKPKNNLLTLETETRARICTKNAFLPPAMKLSGTYCSQIQSYVVKSSARGNVDGENLNGESYVVGASKKDTCEGIDWKKIWYFLAFCLFLICIWWKKEYAFTALSRYLSSHPHLATDWLWQVATGTIISASIWASTVINPMCMVFLLPVTLLAVSFIANMGSVLFSMWLFGAIGATISFFHQIHIRKRQYTS